jgi:flagellar hook protein FlgE
VRQSVSAQGDISYTTSGTTWQFQGTGSSSSEPRWHLRADRVPVTFTKDKNGNLVNAAGFKLMGYPYDGRRTGSRCQRFLRPGSDQRQPVRFDGDRIDHWQFKGNLNSDAPVVAAGKLPVQPAAPILTMPTTSPSRSSMVVYDKLGNKVQYDFYFTKTRRRYLPAGQLPPYRRQHLGRGDVSSLTVPPLAALSPMLCVKLWRRVR